MKVLDGCESRTLEALNARVAARLLSAIATSLIRQSTAETAIQFYPLPANQRRPTSQTLNNHYNSDGFSESSTKSCGGMSELIEPAVAAASRASDPLTSVEPTHARNMERVDGEVRCRGLEQNTLTKTCI